MNDEPTYTAGQAALITTAKTNTQLGWRDRKFLPASDGKWTRYTTRDLCRLRMLKAFSDGGYPMKDAAFLAEYFAGSLEQDLHAKLREAGGPPVHAEQLAVVMIYGSDYLPMVCFDINRIRQEFADGDDHPYDEVRILNLGKLALGMANVMRANGL